jgi:putative tricarboxylic transport membrane protein
VDVLEHIVSGFQDAISPINLLFCFAGVLLGTIIGVLPGLGQTTGVAILLPLTLGLRPLTAFIMLAGIYYGTQYGGTISSVLIATPGEPSTVVTTLDGYQLARQGRGGQALAIAAVGSFLAGTISIVFLMTLAPVFAGFALNFGPPETFALMILGMTAVVGFSGGSAIKGLAMGALGLAISTVGIDAQTGLARFTFGRVETLGGIGFVEVIIGLFAISEVMTQVKAGGTEPIRTRMKDMLLTADDWRRSRMPIVRGGIIGFLIGVLPGAGATLASFFSYDLERRISKHPEEFGKGAIEGVASPEAANNAAVNGAFVPTLTLGIPGSATTAVLLGAFLLFGIRPGPLLIEQQPELVWGLMASFYIGNLFLLILNLPLAPLFASMLRVRYAFVYPIILLMSLVGAYAIENSMWGVWVAFAFGVLGYFMKRYGFPAAPVILGLVLGGLMEKTIVQTSSMGGGSLRIFLERPIALILFALALLAILGPYLVTGVRTLATASSR